MIRRKTANRVFAAVALSMLLFVNLLLVCAYLWPDSFRHFWSGLSLVNSSFGTGK
jgi:hypothetical protein